MTHAIAIVGAGPAGLIAAEHLAEAGHALTIFDQMPSAARKFLLAGRGGLNLTHGEALEIFLTRYTPPAPDLLAAIRAFPPASLIAWAEALGQPCFTGSSGRVFPRAMKASPLLRAWLARLGGLGVALRPRHRWIGMGATGPRFATPAGEVEHPAAATLLAMGGASWPRMGSDGAWAAHLPGVPITPFAPSNAGLAIAWPENVARFAGTPLKRIALTVGAETRRGELMLTATGLEGGVAYSFAPQLRAGERVTLDLRPDLDAAEVASRLAARPRSDSQANRLRKALGLPPVALALLRMAPDPAAAVKALPLPVTGLMGLDRAISSAGGVAWDALDRHFMLRAHPGLFLAGEMLDWEAPTGGYLLQGCFATGVAAAAGITRFLN